MGDPFDFVQNLFKKWRWNYIKIGVVKLRLYNMRNKSKKMLTYVVFYLSIFLGGILPIIIARLIRGGTITHKENILVCAIPFIIVMIFLLFSKRRNIKNVNINSSLNNNQSESLLTDSMAIYLFKVFFIGIGTGSLGIFIIIVFKYYLKLG